MEMIRWDYRVPGLEGQTKGILLNVVEMDWGTMESLKHGWSCTGEN